MHTFACARGNCIHARTHARTHARCAHHAVEHVHLGLAFTGFSPVHTTMVQSRASTVHVRVYSLIHTPNTHGGMAADVTFGFVLSSYTPARDLSAPIATTGDTLAMATGGARARSQPQVLALTAPKQVTCSTGLWRPECFRSVHRRTSETEHCFHVDDLEI